MKLKKIGKNILPLSLLSFIAISTGCTNLFNNNQKNINNKGNVVLQNYNNKYKITSNSLTDFDLSFMKFENKSENKVYSPLSIKYALEMLSEGADGNTKIELDSVIGNYVAKRYTNSSNMSFANALFVKDIYQKSILDSYINNLKTKYYADVVYDSFSSPAKVNSWTSDKTFKLINNLFDDVGGLNYILVNALAIDMEWINKFQKDYEDYYVSFPHENFYAYVGDTSSGFSSMNFNNSDIQREALELSAVINKYDIVSELGKENMRKIVGDAYDEWLNSPSAKYFDNNLDRESYLNKNFDKYIEEINTAYGHISSSTDFSFNDTGDEKVIAKRLKTYDGVTLEYIGIMPKNINLDSYINEVNKDKINNLINGLKEIKSENFEDKYVTKITGSIPTFKFDYSLDLIEDLKKLGITDVFKRSTADLSKLTKDRSYISTAVHKATIDFSNNGIKAAAATALGGEGAGAISEFDYNFEVPVIEIDLTFDKPYMFLIRDKDTDEVWFAGTVYEPNEWKSPYSE